MTLSGRRTAGRLATAVVALALTLTPGVALASGGDDSGGGDAGTGGTAAASAGDFAVTVEGRSYNPAPGRETRLKDVVPTRPRTTAAGDDR